MPKYVFECQNEGCNCRFDRVLKLGDHPTHTCPSCGDDAPRCLEGEGFAFGFQVKESQTGNSGVHKEDYPTADQAVGRSATSRWESYEGRKKVKEEARTKGETHALIRHQGEGFIDYEPMSDNGFADRKARAKRVMTALKVARSGAR